MKKVLSIFKEQLTWWLFSADSPPPPQTVSILLSAYLSCLNTPSRTVTIHFLGKLLERDWEISFSQYTHVLVHSTWYVPKFCHHKSDILHSIMSYMFTFWFINDLCVKSLSYYLFLPLLIAQMFTLRSVRVMISYYVVHKTALGEFLFDDTKLTVVVFRCAQKFVVDA